MVSPQLIDHRLVLLGIEVERSEQVLEQLAELMEKQGFVKPSFRQAMIERERDQPTGLPTPSYGIAIPHADQSHVIKAGIGVALLKNPVSFRMMGDEEAFLEVKAIIMLAIDRPEEQLSMFQSLMEFIQDEAMLYRLEQADTAEAVAELLRNQLGVRSN